MQIESIYIRGFGCLVDRRFEFPEDQAALVIANNETGKSTLAAAIFAGICGFPNQRRSKGSLTLRDAYEPWNSDTYAIEMNLTVNDRRISLERDFARDAFVVRDRETNRDISAEYEKDLASQFLHLPREDFRRIAFISGKDAPSLGPAPMLQARLSAIVDGSSDDTGAELAVAALDSARYTLDTGGPLTIANAVKRLWGSIDEKKRRIDELDSDLYAAGADAQELDRAKSDREALAQKLTELDAEFSAARSTEEKINADEKQRLRAERDLGPARVRLGVIDQQRATGKQLGASVLVAGLAIAAVSFGMWMLEILSVGPSIAAVLLGIAIAAAGAVRASKADTAHADERALLQRQIEETERTPSETLERPTRPSAYVDSERIDVRLKLESLNTRVNELEKQVGATVDTYRREYPVLRKETREMEREVAKAERFGDAIEAAKETLREVAEESRRRWAAALNRSASSALSHLNPDYDNLRFDDSLAFTLRHIPDNKTLEKPDIDCRLSTGAKDQIYLAVRLACCDELSREGESIPVLLDDPLMTADDSRFSTGLQYVAESFAKGHQVIILSCAKGRHEALMGEAWFQKVVRPVQLATK